MTPTELYQQTRLPPTTIYRILKTLVHRGYLLQLPNGSYRYLPMQRKLRFGFLTQSSKSAPSNEISESLSDAASGAGVEPLIFESKCAAAGAIRNVAELLRRNVDLIIEFHLAEDTAAIIGQMVAAARVPLIAIDIPYAHATYLGLDNFRLGSETGESLADYARREWNGSVDCVVGLDLTQGGPLVLSRITGAFEGVRRLLPDIPANAFTRIDGRSRRNRCQHLTAELLAQWPGDKRILIAAANHASALGAVAAVRGAKRENSVAVAAQDCDAETLTEMIRADSPLIVAVSHERASYGAALIEVGIALLHYQSVPPYNYIKHKIVVARDLQR